MSVMEKAPPVAEVVEIGPDADLASPAVRARALEVIEGGAVLMLPRPGFALTEHEREILADDDIVLPGRKERESKTGRPTIFYNARNGRLSFTRIRNPERREIKAMMARYAAWVDELVHTLLPGYAPALDPDRVTFRPARRTSPQGLHIDESFRYPTQGRATLRVFCNINPVGQPRSWQVGESFETLAMRFLPEMKVRHEPGAWLMDMLGVTHGRRTPYDTMIADIRRLVKADSDYQKNAPRRFVDFPAGAAWIGLTDLVVHGAMAGQHSLDQLYFLPIDSMGDPARSSVRILERMTGATLA